MRKKYYYLDLFHGIGGFALGAYWAGMKFNGHYCSDIEPYCQKLYKLRFPNSIQLGDITQIDTEDLPDGEWIITGGFPCQDISIAGRGEGITGSRSGLWFEYWRLIRDLRPRIAIMENVGALTFRGMDRVLGSLSEIGYNAEWQDIRASDVGAPHRRERIWIVAYSNTDIHTGKLEGRRNKIRTAEGKIGDYGERETSYRERVWTQFSASNKNVADSMQPGLSITGDARETGTRQVGIETGTAIDGSDWWSVEPDVGRVAHGIPHRLDRLRGLGNAIVPQIAATLFLLFREYIYIQSEEEIPA